MFLMQRPSAPDIRQFLERCRNLPLSYGPIGILANPDRGQLDEQVVTIGHGDADYARARLALANWQQFDLGWVAAFSDQPSLEPGTNAAVLMQHLGFWSLNGARVLYHVGAADGPLFGFAYGTLTDHAENGEELFELSMDPQSGEVRYRIRAVSWPQSPLAKLGLPIARLLQARFRRDSARVMRAATASSAAAARTAMWHR